MDPLCPPLGLPDNESRTHRRSLRERPCDVLYVHAIEQVASGGAEHREEHDCPLHQGPEGGKGRTTLRPASCRALPRRTHTMRGNPRPRVAMRLPGSGCGVSLTAPPRTAEAVGRVCTRRRAAWVGGWKPGCAASSICACDLRGRTASPTTILVSRTSSTPSRRVETSAIARADAAARRRLGRDASDEGRERITCFAGQRRLPTITGSNTLAKPGILMVYGPKHTPFLNGHRRKLAAVVPPRSVKSITRATFSGAELRAAIATPR